MVDQRCGVQRPQTNAPDDDDRLLAVSEALGISVRTAKYYWTHALPWLFRELNHDGNWTTKHTKEGES